MFSKKFLAFLFLINLAIGQDDFVTESILKLKPVCDYCTCSEISDIDSAHLVLNILCSELDRTEELSDLDKIAWPPNPNGLKISASFEGIGLSTLGKLPPNSQVESLKFINNGIKTYWPDPFSDVPSLKRLSLSQNELVEVTPDIFTKIDYLEELDLSYNKLTTFNPLDFKHLKHLKRLNLQSNQLKKIPVEALLPLIALEDLDLSKNGIYDLLLFNPDTEALSGLKRLSLSGNRIRSIVKDSFPADNNVELLDLSNNIIEIVEEDSFLSFSNLRELNLGQNNITLVFTLPATLQIAILKINTLYHWPSFPNGIKYIDLSYNRLSEMYDENVVDFESLEVLNIGGNQIKEMNIEKKLPNLYTLDVSYNLISEIPKTLNAQFFPNLDELRLDGNPIETVYFKNILALKRLYMNELGKLTVVDDKAFSNVVGKGMDEDGEELNCFSLYLANCPLLTEIKDGAFDGTSLCTLDISKNNLSHLSKNLLDWSILTEGINLQNNPWHCSCDLQWIVDDILPQLYLTNNSRLMDDLRCGTPRGYEGLRLVHWYNWTSQAMCTDLMDLERSGAHGNFLMEPSSENPLSRVSNLTLILAGCIIVSLLIAIALTVYLVKTRKKYRIRQNAMKRKRQSELDLKHSNGMQKEQFSALNKV